MIHIFIDHKHNDIRGVRIKKNEEKGGEKERRKEGGHNLIHMDSRRLFFSFS